MTLLYKLFGKILFYIYGVTGNYGVAIILFAVFARIILLPITIKQTKSMQIMSIINPEVQKVQEKYKNDKNRQGEEMWKVYEKYNYNPVSGCLPLFLQMPILLGLFGVIRQPELYVFQNGMSNVSMSFLWLKDLTMSALEIARANGLSLPTFTALIIPAITVAATFIQNKQSQKNQPQNNNSATGAGMNMTMNMMTVFIGWMSLTFPGALALYWAATTVLTIVQTDARYRFMPVTAESLNVKPTKERMEVPTNATKKKNKKNKNRNRNR